MFRNTELREMARPMTLELGQRQSTLHQPKTAASCSFQMENIGSQKTQDKPPALSGTQETCDDASRIRLRDHGMTSTARSDFPGTVGAVIQSHADSFVGFEAVEPECLRNTTNSHIRRTLACLVNSF